MVRTQIQLTRRQSDALRELARSRGLSVAALIRQSVDRLLESDPAEDLEERKRRALAAVGCLHGGPPDLAVNHDRYLEEDYLS